MEQNTLLKSIAEQSECSIDIVEKVYGTLISVMSDVMGKGERIVCMPDWGRFIPKLRDNAGRNENSPRSMKKPHYYIQFKPSSSFEEAMFSSGDISAAENSGTYGTSAVPGGQER